MKLLFFFLFFGVYFSISYYFIYKFKKSVLINSKLKKVFIIFFILIAISFIVSHFFDTGTIKIVLSFIGYIWLSFVFIFLSFHAFIDLILLIFKKQISKSYIFYFTTFIVITASIYGINHANHINIKNIEIKSPKLLAKSYKIVQLSDVHFSAIYGLSKAIKIEKILNNLKPDLILLTGDFIDRGVINIEQIEEIFKNIKPALGKYAVTGNHEYYSGLEYSRTVLKNSGFILLENSSLSLDEILNIVGVNDITSIHLGDEKLDKKTQALEELKTLKNSNFKAYTILLKHQPKVNNDSIKYFDLQLSGHTHAGQIFPFNFLVKIVFPYIYGLYILEPDKYLYVTSGTGTWGPPIRLFTDSEIVVVDLK